ncbi:MAG: tetratricopeptide repeat protein [Blastocatellia bacterium]|nr:tetratricopeptide repeat protein [Blastocatellia bacterium]
MIGYTLQDGRAKDFFLKDFFLVEAAAIKLRMIVLTVALVALFAVPSAAAQKRKSTTTKPATQNAQAQKEFDDLAKRAGDALNAGRLEEALGLSGEALRRNPNWPEGWWYVGTIFYDHDRYEEARDAFRNLTKLQPQNAPAYALLGLCEYQTREYERALVNLQSARILGLGNNEGLNSVARYHAAILMTRFEQFEVGFEILREFAREQNEGPKIIEAFGINALRMPFLPPEAPPDKREVILLAGRAAYDWAARRTHEAQKGFEDLAARYPQAPNVHYIFGSFLLNQDADAALEEFRKELEISPSHVAAMLQIAFEYIKRGNFKDALPMAEKAVELAPNLFPARNALGRILLETGEIERAVKELEAGVKLAPDSPEMHFILARAYARAGRKEEAAREREIFTKLDKLMRTQREGAQSVGGVDAKPEEKKPQ